MTRGLSPVSGPALDDVFARVKAETGVGRHFIEGRWRKRSLVQARVLAMRIMRDELGMTLEAIGEACGGRSRSTVCELLGVERDAG